MSFQGYKLKVKLHTAYAEQNDLLHDSQFHTFVLALYLKDLNNSMDFFYEMEKALDECLEPLQNAQLEETELFFGKDISMEAIGDELYGLLYEKMREMKFELVKLDIYENPVMSYSVSKRPLDADVNEIDAEPYIASESVEYLKGESILSLVAPTLENQNATTSATQSAIEKEQESLDATTSAAGNANTEAKPGAANASVTTEVVTTDAMPTKGEVVRNQSLKVLMAFLFLVAASTAVVYLIRLCGNYPKGADTFCHLYRGELILQNLKEGTLYPLYDKMWYNGVEIMRYWAPAPLYLLAGLIAIGGSALNGYLLFIGLVFLVGGFGFLLLGIKYRRISLSMLLAVVWFFLPENIRLLIMDGNLPRVVIHMLVPFVILLVLNVLEGVNVEATNQGGRRKKSIARDAILLVLLFAVIGLCHIGIALMLVAILVIFVLIYAKLNHCFREAMLALAAVVIGLLLTGIWLVPSLHGSGVGNSSGGNQVMSRFFVSLFESLNPTKRLQGDLNCIYYGISLLLLSVFGVLFGTKKTKPGFAVGLIIYLCTSQSAYYLFEKLPFSQFLWMLRFVTMSTTFLLVALLAWKGIKRWVIAVLCVAMLLDCIPSYQYVYQSEPDRVADVEAAIKDRGDYLGLTAAKSMTKQRCVVFDLSVYTSFAPYYVSGVDNRVMYTFGAGWEGARTAENIVRLNASVEGGHYLYTFDRALQLGNDTVVFDIGMLYRENQDIPKVIAAGEALGYTLEQQTQYHLLFHRDTPESFGVVTEYKNLAIGQAAKDIALLYPSFEEGALTLDDYTFEDLMGYERLYLSDFSYTDKAKTEDMLLRLANHGTRIYVDMNKVPVNTRTNLQELFGVSIQDITFQYNYPTIHYMGESYETRGFVAGLEEWRAKYLIGLTKVTGSATIDRVALAFTGTAGNDNIVFLGFNFAYYAEVSHDDKAVELLSQILDVREGDLPKRTLVPINIVVEADEITIQSDYDNVNTTYADIDIFHSDKEYEVKNHLIVVDQGTTVLKLRYPYLVTGCIVSALAVVLFVVFCFFLRRYRLWKMQTGVVSDRKEE